MKLIDAIKEHGCPYLVFNCSRDTLPEFCREMGYKVGLEIGVWEGTYTEKFCKEGIKMYGIDPWTARGNQSQKMQDDRCQRAMDLLSKHNCEILRLKSAYAENKFADNSLDFVYIDGNHKFGYVYRDIVEWSKKVRSGGMVAGHDYACTDPEINSLPIRYQLHTEVGQAVDKYVEEVGIKDFYVFGRTKPLIEESKNDAMLSWMWIKQ